MQVWATWLLYVVLVDLTDAIAEALCQPSAAISMEMVYRSIYFFTSAKQRSEADDIVTYLANEAKSLGILTRTSRKRKNP